MKKLSNYILGRLGTYNRELHCTLFKNWVGGSQLKWLGVMLI